MADLHRIPWSEPGISNPPAQLEGTTLALAPGEPWSHAVCIAVESSERDDRPTVSTLDRRAGEFHDGPLTGTSVDSIRRAAAGAPLPLLVDADGRFLCDDPVALCEALQPAWFAEEERDRARAAEVRSDILDAVYELGRIEDQGPYEEAHTRLANTVGEIDRTLQEQRFLGGHRISMADVVLFAFSVRLDPVYYELYKATVGLLDEFRALEGHARDLYDRPAFYETTDFEAIKTYHYLDEPVLNSKSIVPKGGLPDLEAPHFRGWRFGGTDEEAAVEEDHTRSRTDGEWVRPHSEERDWIRSDGSGRYPAEPGRYHLYAPYNCPWSHRALLGRAVLGLEETVGASVVYFRRDPERGWQFNPRIPECTVDRANGADYIPELYESVGSDETSVPLLWDTETDTIVSNESADILRMFSTEFDAFRTRDIDLYPDGFRRTIDRLNAAVYQRINNGAYKAGFSGSQLAYERAFDRYFRALEWLDGLLEDRRWLAGSPEPTEADLRLFPTIFRHDAVYYARFKLNADRLEAYPALEEWLERMLEVPGVAEASNLDHARNGYFGRTGNEIVPAGPVPLELSPKDFSREVWLNR